MNQRLEEGSTTPDSHARMRDEKKQALEAYNGDGTHPITTPDLPIRRFRRFPNLGRRFLKGDLAEHGFGNQRYFDREKSQGGAG